MSKKSRLLKRPVMAALTGCLQRRRSTDGAAPKFHTKTNKMPQTKQKIAKSFVASLRVSACSLAVMKRKQPVRQE